MFNEKTFTLDSIKSLAKKDKNKKIIELFEKFEVVDSKAVNETISKLMKGSGDIKKNKISVSSPIAKALLGKRVGEIVEVQVPAGTINFEVLSVQR